MDLFTWCVTVISIFCSCGPIPSLISASKSKNVSTIPISFLMLTTIVSSLWFCYAVIFAQLYLIPVQVILLTLNFSFCVWYHYLTNTLWLFFLQALSYFSFLWLLLRYIAPFLGMLLVFVNSLPFLGLLEKIKIFLKTKDPAYAEIKILIPTVLNASMWVCLSYMKKDVYLAIPNSVGFLVGAL